MFSYMQGLTSKDEPTCLTCGMDFIYEYYEYELEDGEIMRGRTRHCNCLQNVTDLEDFLKEHPEAAPEKSL